MSPVHIPAVLTKEEGFEEHIADMLKEMGGCPKGEGNAGSLRDWVLTQGL